MSQPYFPEGSHETARLEKKTDVKAVVDQAQWAGVKPGMRILDVGCGPGITSAALFSACQPDGSVVGIDLSEERIDYARARYGRENVEFHCRDFFEDISDLGKFDVVWVRFVLEFYCKEAAQLVEHLKKSLRKGGTLILIDLDMNCMNHYGLSERLNQSIYEVMVCQMQNNNFDPFAGRKLYQYLIDAGMEEVRIDMRPHHLIYGDLSEIDREHWWQKIELAGKRSGHTFSEYEGGYEEFEAEFKQFFSDPKRLTYTPVFIARGDCPPS